MNGAWALVAQDTEVAEALNAAFTSVFTSKTDLQESKAPETRGQVWNGKDTLGGRGSGHRILMQTAHSPDEMQPPVLRANISPTFKEHKAADAQAGHPHLALGK